MGEEAREEDAMFGKEEKTTRGAVEREEKTTGERNVGFSTAELIQGGRRL